MNAIFENNNHIGYRIYDDDIVYRKHQSYYNDLQSKTYFQSEKQAEKLLVINQIINIAKYFNKDWVPDWNDKSQRKYFIFIDNAEKTNKKIAIGITYSSNNSPVYFASLIVAKQVIDTLGEDVIKEAFNTD